MVRDISNLADVCNIRVGTNVSHSRDVAMSMFQWNLLSKNKPFVGFENFIELFQDNLFLTALSNTAIIAFGAMIVTIPASMLLAAVIYHRTKSRFAGFYETAVFIPHVVSLVPAAMAWKWILDAKLVH